MPRKFDFLSPGIEITEVDQSILPAEVDADGPVIIGRFRKGPGMKPAKVRSLDYFISVYGNPIPGGSSLKGDIWRDGPQLSAPTYGAYAAQSWLASRTSPVNVVRLLGDQHPSATGDGIAGWQLSASIPSTTQADNSTAYGLFIIDDDKTGKATSIDITIATGFNENNIGNSSAGDECKLRFLKGTTDHTVSTKADGQLIEIIFDETSNAYGDVSRAATGGGSDSTVPLFTCPVKNLGGSFLEVLKQVEKAFLLAISSGDITNVSVSIDENGDSSVLKIFNLDTTTGTAGQIAITDAATSPDQFQGAGLTILGANRPAIDLDDGAAASTVAAIGATRSAGEGALAAIFYCDSGYMALKGTYADGGSTQTSSAETLISSSAANIGFTMEIYSATGTSPSETISLNFNRNSTSYVRNKFNTNPQLTNSGVTDVDDLKTYWLGETFERHLKTKVTSTTA